MVVKMHPTVPKRPGQSRKYASQSCPSQCPGILPGEIVRGHHNIVYALVKAVKLSPLKKWSKIEMSDIDLTGPPRTKKPKRECHFVDS